MATELVLTAITTTPSMIRAADAAGVDRIGIDIERIGKAQRQGHIPDARISGHQLADLRTVADNVRRAALFVRINPLHEASRQEIDAAISLGAQVLVLPQFHTAGDAEAFVEMVGGRAMPVLLLETANAVENLAGIAAVKGVAEIMVGLNDLHRDLGMSSHFDVIVSGLMARISAAAREAGVRFGFGGLARVGDETLPVPPGLIYPQYPRLGATSAWLSRSFFRGLAPDDVAAAVRTLREEMAFWACQSEGVLRHKQRELADQLQALQSASR